MRTFAVIILSLCLFGAALATASNAPEASPKPQIVRF